jgi:hypothetical protein
MSNSESQRTPMPKGMETTAFVARRKKNRKRAQLAKASRKKNRT